MNKFFLTLLLALSAFSALFAQEKHLGNIKKLTFGGDNAEAYFSPDGTKLSLQVTNPAVGAACDQIYMLDLKALKGNSSDLKLLSTGKGRTTCSYFMPDGKHILYASTHERNEACPEPPKSYKGKYVWAIYPDFDIYTADLSGKIVKKLTDEKGYDAEATVSPDGKKIVFTSMRSGDLELYTMNIDGTNVKQITFGLGYDGGAFFSPDSKKIVFRSSRPKTDEEVKEYKELLAQNLVAPTEMELFVCNADGSDLKQVTNLGKANWAPFFHPAGKKIIFSSNHHSTRGYDFQLYCINLDGTGLEQITFESEFNAFPMFSPDGKKLVFSSNRQQSAARETNVFLADWIDFDDKEKVNPEELKKNTAFLASDKLNGRLAGSEGEKLAAEYIEKHFKKVGLKPLDGKSFMQIFDYSYNPDPHQSETKTKVTVTAQNVAGYLDNGAAKTVIIGAHYDHLGLNERHHSTAPNAKNEIHNGADDNASGVSAMMELARIFSQNNVKEKSNFVFVAFSGEEDGLMGSKHFADIMKEKFPAPSVMLNMDMVGRLDSMKNFNIHGVGTGDGFVDLVNRLKPAGFNLSLDSSGVGPSDHTSFYLKDIPVLFFFTGLHTDYHKPSDDTEKINFRGLQLTTEYVLRIAEALSEKEKIAFFKTKLQSTDKKAAKYKVTLGVMPDYKDYGDGLHIESVIEGRTAQKAGLTDGDIVIKLGDCEIKEVYAYMECLSKFNAGDETTITFKRNGEVKTAKIKF